MSGVDADAAQAAAQKLADQFASQGGQEGAAGPGAPAGAENGEQPSHKRKLEGGDEEEAAMRKRASFNGPQDGEQAAAAAAPAAQQAVQPAAAAPAAAAPAPTPLPVTAEPAPAAQSQHKQSGPVMGPSGEFTDTVIIPASCTGKLIGKAGETIKHIQNSTGTRVQIDHTYPGNEKAVAVTGASAEACLAARRQIEAIASDEPAAGETQRQMDCPQGIVGRVIGRGGETIRALQQASFAHILVDQNFPEGHPRRITISGKADAVDRAAKMIDELIHGEPGSAQAIIQKYGAGVTKVVECTKSIVGRIIGKSGETIKMLQKQFSVNIQIDQSTDPMRVNVAGQPPNVEQAAAAVQEIIRGGNPFGGPVPGFGIPPTASTMGGMGAMGGMGGPRGPAGFGGGFGGPAAYGAFPYGGYGGFPPAAAAAYGGFPGAYPPQAFGGGGGFPGAGAGGGFGGGAAGGGGYGAGGGAGGGYGGPDPYGGGGGYGAGGGGASVWQELQDDQGRSYYYNTQTGVSQWEKPDGFGR